MNAARINLNVDLPSMPFVGLIKKTLARVAASPAWAAYRDGFVGREVAEAVLKAAFFEAITAQDKDTFHAEARGHMIDAFEQAFHMCVPE